jgi:hypothetical protein
MTMNTITGIVAILIGVAYSYLAWDLPGKSYGANCISSSLRRRNGSDGRNSIGPDAE